MIARIGITTVNIVSNTAFYMYMYINYLPLTYMCILTIFERNHMEKLSSILLSFAPHV